MPSLTRLIFTFALVSHMAHPIAAISPGMTLTIEQAVDVVEIQQTLNLFAIAVDQHRLELLPQVFTADVIANFSIPGGTIQHGLDAVTQLLMTLQAIPSLHYQSTNYLNFTTSQQAHATTYLTGTFFGSGDLQGQIRRRPEKDA
ncbi:MAG: hypothetical protein Q9175_005100 [Cornicularia normoerica]